MHRSLDWSNSNDTKPIVVHMTCLSDLLKRKEQKCKETLNIWMVACLIGGNSQSYWRLTCTIARLSFPALVWNMIDIIAIPQNIRTDDFPKKNLKNSDSQPSIKSLRLHSF